jgi:hypothetical protein
MFDSGFQKLADSDPFRQGDIICHFDNNQKHAGLPAGAAGVIITADCDIAQDKFGEFYSFLPIVSAEQYLDSFWAPSRLDHFISDACKQAADLIHRADRRRDPNVDRLTDEQLLAWIEERGRKAILTAVPLKVGQETKAVEAQLIIIETAMRISHRSGYINIERVKDCWDLVGRTVEDRAREIKRGLAEMTQSFFLLPDLPNYNSFGHIITLRDVRSIHAEDVYRTRAAVPYYRHQDLCMYRVGRFSDRVRFAVAQKFATLFSRIGMTTRFEGDCKAIPEIVIKSLLDTVPGSAKPEPQK